MTTTLPEPTSPTPAHHGRLIVLVGPAGAGKTTIAHRLVQAASQRRGFSVSHTTRPIRPNEVHGRDYWFVSRPEFETLRDAGGMAEWAEVHGNLYGTSRAEITRHLAAGRDILFDIDIVGAHNLLAAYPAQTRLCFVVPPSWQALKARLVARGTETDATLRRRLHTARTELHAVLASQAAWSVIRNDVLDDAVAEAESLFAAAPPQADAVADDPIVLAFAQDADADRLAQ